MKDLVRLIKDKSIVLSGGDVSWRNEMAEKIRSGWKQKGKSEVFALKPGVKDHDSLLEAFRKSLPLTSPLKTYTKDMMNHAQISDYWIEWPSELKYNSALIIFPELDALFAHKKDKESVRSSFDYLFSKINNLYVNGQCELRALLTFQTLPPKFAETFANLVPPQPVGTPLPDRKYKTFAEMIEVISV